MTSNTYGPGALLLTAFLSVALWGTTCTQTFTYFLAYPKDRAWLKCMVIWLWLLDTVHQAVVIVALYGIFVTRFGDFGSLAFLPKDFISVIILTVLVSSTAQLFFTYRIWLFSGKKWMFPAVAVPMVLGQLVLQTYYMSLILRHNTLAELRKENSLGITFNTLAAVTDIALACCMIYLLQSERSGFNSSDQLVSKLILFSFNSGLWTALVALAVVITSVAVPLDLLVYPGVYSVLCPLYCNTVLANLNSRKFLQSPTNRHSSTPAHGSGNVALETFSRPRARAPQDVITIQVDTTKAADDSDYYLHESNDHKVASALTPRA